MTEEKQRIAIAEFCGWKNIYIGGLFRDTPIGHDPSDRRARIVPNYPRDLNAMHAAEKLLKDEPRPRIGHSEMTCYVAKLDEITGGEGWHATAAQRAEALLRTIEKWEDS
jgi:hypothetical protein